MKAPEPSKLEMQVLGVLWQRGPSTVRDVLTALQDEKSRAYTTILSVMQVMEKKGLLSHTSDGNAHVYAAEVSRRSVAGPLLRGLVKNLFGGSAASALQHLLNENDMSREELEQIKGMIQAEEQRKGSSKKTRKKGDV